MRRYVTSFLIMFLLLSSTCIAVDSWNVSKVTEFMDFWYRIYDFEEINDCVYSASWIGGVHKTDLSDPFNPEVQKQLNIVRLTSIEHSGSYLYLTGLIENHTQVFYSVDISNRENPVVVDSLILDCSFLRDLDIHRSVAFLSTNNAIITVDISDPTSMTEINTFNISIGNSSFSIFNDYGYFIYGDNIVKILNVSDPSNIFEEAEFLCEVNDVDFRNGFVLAENGLLYISAYGDLIILDVSDPENVSTMSQYFVSDRIGDIHKDGEWLCCSGGTKIRLFNISNPGLPILSDAIPINDHIPYQNTTRGNRIKKNEDTVFLLSGVMDNIGYGNTISSFEINENQNLNFQGSIDFEENFRDIEVKNDTAVLLGNKAYIVDVSDYYNTRILHQINRQFDEIDVNNAYLYGRKRYRDLNTDSMFVYELIPDSCPALRYQFVLPRHVEKMKIENDRLVIAHQNYFSSYDISDPSVVPPLQFTESTNVNLGESVIRDNMIYVVGNSNEGTVEKFIVFQISVDQLELVSETYITFDDRWDSFSHLSLTDSYAIVGDNRRYGIIDIIDLENPELIYLQDGGDGIGDLHAKEDRILQTTDRGIKITDISDPLNPVPAGYYNGHGAKAQFDVENDCFFICSVSNIQILEGAHALQVNSPGENNIPDNSFLLDTYPNPFNPTLNIQVTFTASERLRLSIHNILGQELAVIVDQEFSEGIYKFIFDGSHYSSGHYYVKSLVNNDRTRVQKITLIK